MIDLIDDISYENLLQYIEFYDPPLPDSGISAHVQGTERYAKLLTNVSRRAIDGNRDDIMAVTAESRTRAPRMNTKKYLISNRVIN